MSIKNIVSLVLVLFSIMISCVPDDKSVGNQFVSGDYLLKLETASFNLDITNKRPDSIQALSRSYMMVGYLADPVLGVTTSSAIVQILPFSDTTDFGESSVVESVTLNLIVGDKVNYSKEYEGIAQNISVYRLKKALDSTVLSTPLFNTSYKVGDDYDLDNPIHIGSPVYYGGNSIEIALSIKFGEELLATTPGEFENAEFFIESIKGLYITIDTPKGIEEGGRLNYLTIGHPGTPYSNGVTGASIKLNYLFTDAEQGLTDRDSTETFAVGYNFALNQVQSGTKIEGSNDLKESVYIDGFSGIKPHIKGSRLKAQLDEWLEKQNYTSKSIILSKASINLPFEMPNDYMLLSERYPKIIYPCRIDSLQSFQPLDDIYSSSKIGLMDRSLLLYPCDITSYIQDLIKIDAAEVAKDNSYDLWLSPIASHADDSGGISYYFDNQDYSNGTLNGPTAIKKPTLSLVFTVLSE